MFPSPEADQQAFQNSSSLPAVLAQNEESVILSVCFSPRSQGSISSMKVKLFLTWALESTRKLFSTSPLYGTQDDLHDHVHAMFVGVNFLYTLCLQDL